MHPKFKKYIIRFSVWLLLLPSVVHACGPSLFLNEGRFSLFQSGLDGFQGLEPFYFSENFLNSYQPDPAGLDYKRNCEEWRKYCGGKVLVEDIYQMQYKTAPDSFLIDIANNDWNKYQQNSFIKWLRLPNHKEALDYFVLSKKIEFTQFGDRDPWREGDYMQVGKVFDYCDTAIKLCTSTKDRFLRERYAFQALKMEYYGYRNYERPHVDPSALPLYNKYLKNSKSVVAGWAALFYGLRQSNNNLRTLYLLKAFDLSEEKKVFCYLNIQPEAMDSLLQVSKDKKTRELVCVLKAMRTYGRAFEKIKELYRINPDSKYLPMIISREINKLEDWIWSPELLNFSTLGLDENKKVVHAPGFREYWYRDFDEKYYAKINRESDLKYLKSLRQFLSEMKLKHGKPFVQLSLAHLYNMTKDYNIALKELQDMPDLNDNKLEAQKLIEKVIASAYTSNVKTKRFQEHIAKDLKKLYSLNDGFSKRDTLGPSWEYDYGTDESMIENNDDFGELLLMLSNRYKEQGDLLTAGLLYLKANVVSNICDGYFDYEKGIRYRDIAYFDRNAEANTMDELLKFIHKKGKSDFETLLVPDVWADENLYKDLKGTILMRQEKYHEALEVFMDVDSGFWQSSYYYAYYLPKTTIRSLGSMTPWVNETATKYSQCDKSLIVKDITQIQDSLKNNKLNEKQKALLHLHLGNCLFNISYFGKAWMMESYGWSSREEIDDKGFYAYFSFYPNNLRYGKNYYGCEAAKKEYQIALKLSTEKELKLQALLNLRLCEQHSFYTKDNKTSPYTTMLDKYYDNESSYQLALSVCPDIRIDAK